MSFHVPQTLGGGWIVQTPHGVRFEAGALPSCVSRAVKTAAQAECAKGREQIRGFGAGFNASASFSTSGGGKSSASASGRAKGRAKRGGGSDAGPSFGPVKSRDSAICQLAKRPVCPPTTCLDVPALNRVLDNVKNRARGGWAAWGMTPEAKAMQLGVACHKLSAPKCLYPDDQKLLDYYKKYGWSGPDVELNGKVWVKRAQTPRFFQTPRCPRPAMKLPSMPKPSPKRPVMKMPVMRRHAPPPPPMRVATQLVPAVRPAAKPAAKPFCTAAVVRSLKAKRAMLLARANKSGCFTPSEMGLLRKIDATLAQKCRVPLPYYKTLKVCEREGAAPRVVTVSPPPSAYVPPAAKSPEVATPVLAPPAYQPPPAPAPEAPTPSPEAPAPIVAPAPSEPEVTPEPVVTYPTEPELPGGEEMESKPFPWWLIAVAAGGGYYLYKRSKKGKRTHA